MTATDLEPVHSAGPNQASLEDVETALLAVAMSSSLAEAGRRLKALDPPLNVSGPTLRKWRDESYPNRYRAVAMRHQADIELIVTGKLRELALAASDAALEAVQMERARLASKDGVRDAAYSAQAMAKAAATAVDKLLLVQGRPTAITQTRSADDVLKALERKGYVDSTAVEVAPEGPSGPV